ncbi:hypothetical protein [Actinoplanes siamensis]|uniref:Serine protease n=1 Tax=Actinoplanes siamensis TaxID=1223317 RepID=A0A919N6F9_9ACTN|nr:hypothetical protein [Actinoplanes siamensis]GIF05222.1 hypothetical protein Asi03nite_27600 [Actinoplanes siamensis]
MTRVLREPSQIAVARILRERDGRPVGAAVLVGARHVVTAGHNAEFALERAPAVGDLVRVDFPLVAPGDVRLAEVRRYLGQRPQQAGDLCGLVLTGDPPAGVRPAPVVPDNPPAGTEFRLFGVPENREAGFWLETVSQGMTAGGLLQMQVVPHARTGERAGYSGGPLWAPAHRAVCGIVLSAEEGLDWRTAYALPFGEIHRMWPELRAACRPPQPYRGLHCFDEADREPPVLPGHRDQALAGEPLRHRPVPRRQVGHGHGGPGVLHALPRGAPLRAAHGWLVRRPDDLSAAEQEFIRTGFAREQRRRRARRTLVALVSVVALLVATAGTVLYPVARDRLADGLRRTADGIGRADEGLRTILDLAAARMRGRLDTVRPVLDDLLDNTGTVALLPVTGAVAELAVAGDRVLIRDRAGRLTGWRIGAGRPRRVISESNVSALAAGPALVATGDVTGRITVRDAASWAVLREFAGPPSSDSEGSAVHALAFDVTGARIAAVAATSRRVRVYDLGGGRTWDRTLGDRMMVERLGFTPGGAVVAARSASAEFSLSLPPVVWNPVTARVTRVRAVGPPGHLAFGTPTLIAGCRRDQLVLSDPETGRPVSPAVRRGCGARVAAVGGPRVVALEEVAGEQVGTAFPTVPRILAFDGQRLAAAVPGRPRPDGPYAVGPGSRYLIAASADGVVRVIRPPARPPVTVAPIAFARFLPDGSLIALHDDNLLELLDRDGSPRASVRVDSTGTPGDHGTVALAPDGSFLAVLSRPGGGTAYQVNRYELPALRRSGRAWVTVPVDALGAESAVTVLGDGRIVVRSNDDLLIYPADPAAAPPRRITLTPAEGGGRTGTTLVAARPGGSEVAVAAADGSGFQLVDVDKADMGTTWGPLPGGPTRLILFPDAEHAVVVGEGGTDAIDMRRRILERSPPTAPAEATGAVGHYTTRPLSNEDAGSVVGWPAVLRKWGLPRNLDRLWPDDMSARVPGEGRRLLLSPDRERFAVVRNGAVEVFPTSFDGWRSRLCEISAPMQDGARDRMGPAPWMVDPCP